MSRTLKCRVLTPNGLAMEQEAEYVRLPAYDGLIGILPGHAALLATVGKGVLMVCGHGDHKWQMELDGGFMEVREDVVTIAAEQAGELLEWTEETKPKTPEDSSPANAG